MDEREQKSGSGGLVVGCTVLLLLPVLYVLGIGPAAWFDDRTPTGSQFLRAMYVPPIKLVNHSQPTEQALDWYIQLWR